MSMRIHLCYHLFSSTIVIEGRSLKKYRVYVRIFANGFVVGHLHFHLTLGRANLLSLLSHLLVELITHAAFDYSHKPTKPRTSSKASTFRMSAPTTKQREDAMRRERAGASNGDAQQQESATAAAVTLPLWRRTMRSPQARDADDDDEVPSTTDTLLSAK
jgi:hypothetical protein